MSKNFHVKNLSDQELLVCMLYTNNLLKDINLIEKFFDDDITQEIQDDDFHELEFLQKVQHIQNVFDEYLVEFNYRNQN